MHVKIYVLCIVGWVMLVSPSETHAQNEAPRESQANTYRDPGTARLYAFLGPGVGHLYAREKKKGLTLMLVGGGALIGGGLGASLTCLGGEGCSSTPYFVGLLVFVGAWGYGIYDAAGAARRTNARNGFTASIRPTVVPVSRSSVRAGLALRVNW